MRRRSFLFHVGYAVALLVFAAEGRAMSGPEEAFVKAISAGDPASVQTLLAEGVSPDTRNEKGMPALSLAARAAVITRVNASSS